MPKRFPAIELIAKHGRMLAALLAGLCGLLSVAGFVLSGHSTWLVGGLPASCVLYVALRVTAELVEVIAETLLPR